MKHFIYSTLVFLGSMILVFWLSMEPANYSYLKKGKITSYTPKSVQLFYAIEKYSAEYKVPRDYAYGIAYYETRYTGPFQWDYDNSISSAGGALGPMQVMYSTAKSMFPDEDFTKEDLKNDIELNVKCSMKLCKYLYDNYRDWKIVFGCYNTGRPIINSYANNVVNYKLK